MDIFFQDPDDIPLPPDEVRIREFRADPWPDGRRVRVYLEVTPFQRRPSGEINIVDDQGEEVTSVSIIETIDPKMEFTLHIPSPKRSVDYIASSIVFYAETETAEGNEATGKQASEESVPLPPSKITVVDQAKTTFRIEE